MFSYQTRVWTVRFPGRRKPIPEGFAEAVHGCRDRYVKRTAHTIPLIVAELEG